MEKELKIKEEVEKTIKSLDNLKNIESNPFLFTRIKAQIDSLESDKKMSVFSINKKILQPVFFASLFAINMFSAVSLLQEDETTSISRDKYITTIAEEYSLNNEYNYLEFYEN